MASSLLFYGFDMPLGQKIEAVESWGIVPVRRSLWRMAEVFGGEPRFDYFETPVVIDNAFK